MSETAPEAPAVTLEDHAASADEITVLPGGEEVRTAFLPAPDLQPPAAPPAQEPEPVVVLDVPVTMAEATAGEAGISSVTTHPGVLVRLRDVHAAVENFFARHPVLARELGIDLKSALDALERPSDPGRQA